MDDLQWVDLTEKLRAHALIHGYEFSTRPLGNSEPVSPVPVLRALFLSGKNSEILSAEEERQIRFLAAGVIAESSPAASDADMTAFARDILALHAESRLAPWINELSVAPSQKSALNSVRSHLPHLKPDRVARFLKFLGIPAGCTLSPKKKKFLEQFESQETFSPSTGYLQFLKKIRRLTAIDEVHADSLFAIYMGEMKLLGDDSAAICLPNRPKCEICSVTSYCKAYRFNTLPAPAEKPARTTKPIKEWVQEERPRERLLAGEQLSAAELLAVILRTGSGKLSAVELGREILNRFGSLHDLEKASPQDILQRMKGMGIGPAKAVEIKAAIELGKRITASEHDPRKEWNPISGSRDIFQKYRTRYKAATQEEFLLVILNTKHKIQKDVSISVGTLNSSIVHPRDVFHHALREAAASVIFVHNHPSGDPTPSPEDFSITKRLAEAGTILGIKVLDHIIIGSHDYYSFADSGTL